MMKPGFVRLMFCFFTVCLSSCVLIPTDFYLQRENNTFEKGVTDFNTSNFSGALKNLAVPAKDGNMDAQYLMGLIYMYGLSPEGKNSYLAEKWLNMAASAGQTAAQVQLAFLYQDRNTPLYNPLAAYHWFNIVIADKPEYRTELDNLRWTLERQGQTNKIGKLDLTTPDICLLSRHRLQQPVSAQIKLFHEYL